MYTIGKNVWSIAIMNDNNILQTKYVISDLNIPMSSSSIGDSVHIVIENVTKHMGTTLDDAWMNEDPTNITINNESGSNTRCTWTSTICPDNVTVELNCKVVETSGLVGITGSIVTANCGPDQWPNSVFNRIPILVSGSAQFVNSIYITRVMFGTSSFSFDGSVPAEWTKFNVSGHGSSLIIGNNKVTIKNLPESFVSHWVDTIHAKAYMGKTRVMLVPPE